MLNRTITQSGWRESRWVAKTPTPKTTEPAARVFTEEEIKVLLAPSKSDWADEESQQVEDIQLAAAAKPEPISYSDALAPIRNRPATVTPVAPPEPEVALDDTPTPAEAAAAAKLKQAAKSKGATPKVTQASRQQRESTEQKDPPAANPKPSAWESGSWRRPEKQPDIANLASIMNEGKLAPKAPRGRRGAVPDIPCTGDPEQVRADTMKTITEAQRQAPKHAKAAAAAKKPNRRPRRYPTSDQSAAESQATEPVPAPEHAPVLVDSTGPLKPNPWTKRPEKQPTAASKVSATPEPKRGERKTQTQRAPATDKITSKPQVTPVVEPVFTDAPVKPSKWSTDAPVSAIFKPQAETPRAVTSVEPVRQAVVVKLPPTVAPSSPPRRVVSPVTPVIPRTFERAKITPPQSEAQPQSLETGRGTDGSVAVIVADSAASPSRYSEAPEQSFNTASSPRSNLSAAVSPFIPSYFVPGGQSAQFSCPDTLPPSLPQYSRSLPELSTVPFETTFPDFSTVYTEATPPVLPTVPIDLLRQECNRLDLILEQSDLIRAIEVRAARLALRGLFPDGRVRDPLQVEFWEMQQQQQQQQYWFD